MKKIIIALLLPVSILFANSYMKGDYEEVGFGQKSFLVAYPNQTLTPGDILVGATKETVCAPGYSRKMRRKLSRQDKVFVYERYGLPYDSKHYQIDHFIPLSIGGSNEIENLWPQPIVNNAGYLEKQRVADYLHRAVCSDQISITDAQDMVAKDWHAVYLKFIGGKKK